MAAEPMVTANADIPDATRAHTAYLTTLEHITLQMTAKLVVSLQRTDNSSAPKNR